MKASGNYHLVERMRVFFQTKEKKTSNSKKAHKSLYNHWKYILRLIFKYLPSFESDTWMETNIIEESWIDKR